jgi:pimeloyl-ACP methyl ester carboxylesterase
MLSFSTFTLVVAISTVFCMHRPVDAQPANYQWQQSEMTNTGFNKLRGKYRNEQKIRSGLDGNPIIPTDCSDDNVCFDLYYFKGENFDSSNSARKNILYITGGPGRVPSSNELFFLEQNHNVLYFFLRGAGLSLVPSSNTFDQYLKADFVLGDIERLRTEVLKQPRWDAIYALSYGSIIAQKYAWRYPEKVERLILESPVSRQSDYRDAERSLVLKKLRNIYNWISSTDSVPCDCRDRSNSLKVSIQPTAKLLDPGDNFCFLRGASSAETENRIAAVTAQLDGIYKRLQQIYGALGFVTENFDDLRNDNAFSKSFPYPKEFFLALKDLQSRGAPEDENALLFGDIVRAQVDAAMVAGYYSSLSLVQAQEMQQNDFPRAEPTDPFINFAEHPRCVASQLYAKRLDEARSNLRGRDRDTESERALYVFGLHDGTQPGVVSIVNRVPVAGSVCVTSNQLNQFQSSTDDATRQLRKIISKIGMIPLEANQGCLWDPGAQSPHDIPTLVLKGGADGVTAGCQVEYFFNKGLAGTNRALFEFPGMGHILRSENIRMVPFGASGVTNEWGNSYQKLLESFLTIVDKSRPASGTLYRKNVEVIKARGQLTAQDKTPESGQAVPCQ